MNEKNLSLLVAIITLAVAITTIRSGVMSPTGAFIRVGTSGSVLVAALTVIISLTLFAKYFDLIR